MVNECFLHKRNYAATAKDKLPTNKTALIFHPLINAFIRFDWNEASRYANASSPVGARMQTRLEHEFKVGGLPTIVPQSLTPADALTLYQSADLHALGAASKLNTQKNGFQGDLHRQSLHQLLNYCILSCQFCSFSRKKRIKMVSTHRWNRCRPRRKALALGITELHIVGGLHPSLPFSYYTDMLKGLKAVSPGLQLKCFTAIKSFIWLGSPNNRWMIP